MRTIPALILWTVLLLSGVATAQRQVSGRIVDRNGSPQGRCLVEFFVYPNQPPVYRITANNEGYFYLSDPKPARYSVRVRLGQRLHQIDVTIDEKGLQPSTIVVSW
jgi:hypothetical protein